MKKGVHPEYYRTTITCACGASFETGSTKKDLRVEICSQCHPLFTGQQKIVDTGGRVERFLKKYGLDKDKKKNRCSFYYLFTSGGRAGALLLCPGS